MRKMEQENKHLLANLFSQKPMHNQSLAQTLAQNQLLKQKLTQHALQRTQTGNIPQLQRAQPTLQQSPHNLSLLPIQRNSSQTQHRTHNSWPNNSTSSSSTTTNQGPRTNTVIPSYRQFYTQHSLMSPFQQPKNPSLPPHQTTLSPNLSSKSTLDDILDLTVSSPSPSPDSTEGGLSLDNLTGNPAAFTDDFNLESLISQNATNSQHTAPLQQPLLLQQQHLQASQQQQNHNLLANNHPDLLELFDLPLSPQMPMQKVSPSSSTSSSSSSISSTTPLPNNLVSIFSSPSSSSLFSNSSSHFPSSFMLPQSDSVSLPNGHCNSAALDVREALNSMLQAGPERRSVIQYRQQD